MKNVHLATVFLNLLLTLKYKIKQLLIKKKSMECAVNSINSINSFWPSDAIWRHRSGLTLAQVMAWYLMAPSHYMNHCYLITDRFCDIDMRAQKILLILISMISLKIAFLKLLQHLPDASEFTYWFCSQFDTHITKVRGFLGQETNVYSSVNLSSLVHLTHCGLGDFNEILDECFSNQLQWLMAETPAVKLPSEKCH